jgi:hypothetical protein
LTAFGVISVLDLSHSNRYVIVALILIFIFLMIWDEEHLSICLLTICLQENLTLLNFTDTVFFTNWSFVATLHQANCTRAIFPNACVHLVYPYHILVVLAIFLTFNYYLYLLWWSVSNTFDVTIVIFLGHHKPHQCKRANLIDKGCVCSDSYPNLLLPISLLGFLFPETQQYWN